MNFTTNCWGKACFSGHFLVCDGLVPCVMHQSFENPSPSPQGDFGLFSWVPRGGDFTHYFVPVSGNLTGFHTHTEWMSLPCPGRGVQMTGAVGTFDCCVCCLDSAGTNYLGRRLRVLKCWRFFLSRHVELMIGSWPPLGAIDWLAASWHVRIFWIFLTHSLMAYSIV